MFRHGRNFNLQAYTTQKVAQVDAHVQAVATNPPEWNNATNISYIYPKITIGTTNEVLSSIWGDSTLNSPFFWNPAFNVGGSHGAYTNINARVMYFDTIGINGHAGVYCIDTWPTNGTSNLVLGFLTPENNSWGVNNLVGAVGTTAFPRVTNLVQANFIVNPTGPDSKTHVYVAVDGWDGSLWLGERDERRTIVSGCLGLLRVGQPIKPSN